MITSPHLFAPPTGVVAPLGSERSLRAVRGRSRAAQSRLQCHLGEAQLGTRREDESRSEDYQPLKQSANRQNKTGIRTELFEGKSLISIKLLTFDLTKYIIVAIFVDRDVYFCGRKIAGCGSNI